MPTRRSNLARAEQAQRAARERLTRLLGLWGDADAVHSCPSACPTCRRSRADQPGHRAASRWRSAWTCRRRRLAAEQTARNLGLTRDDALHQRARARASCATAPTRRRTQRGWEIGFELPLFDWGDARVATRRGDLPAGACTARRETAINARSEVREAYGGYRSAYDIARHHRDEIVPLRKRIAEENLLRYNGMLIGVFELLADARAQIASVNAAIEALRDFWLAQADLDMALIGKPSLAPPRRPRDGGRRRRRRRTEPQGTRPWFPDATSSAAPVPPPRPSRAAAVSKVAMAALPEPVIQTKPDTHAAAGAATPAGPTTRWSRSTAGRCPGA